MSALNLVRPPNKHFSMFIYVEHNFAKYRNLKLETMTIDLSGLGSLVSLVSLCDIVPKLLREKVIADTIK